MLRTPHCVEILLKDGGGGLLYAADNSNTRLFRLSFISNQKYVHAYWPPLPVTGIALLSYM
jgi:hypothetical protein